MAEPRNIAGPNLPVAPATYNRVWQDQFNNILRLFFSTTANAVNLANTTPKDTLELTDGVTAPATGTGRAIIYVDSADGDLKIKFSDGTVKTIITD